MNPNHLMIDSSSSSCCTEACRDDNDNNNNNINNNFLKNQHQDQPQILDDSSDTNYDFVDLHPSSSLSSSSPPTDTIVVISPRKSDRTMLENNYGIDYVDDHDDCEIETTTSLHEPIDDGTYNGCHNRKGSKRRYRSISPLHDDDEHPISRDPSILSNERSVIFKGDNSFINVSTSSIREAIHELRSSIQDQANQYRYDNNDRQSRLIGTNQTTSCLWCWCRLAYYTCHTALLIVLTGAVIMLSYQVRKLQNHVDEEEDAIATLQKQIVTQEQSQQNLNQKVVEEHSFTMYQVAGTFTLLTCLITMFHMTQHLGNWHEPVIQRKIITILWMSPIYSVTSWLSLVFPSASGYLSVVKDFYEAHVIYTFLSFLIAVLGRGDRNVAIMVLSYHADHLNTPTRFFSSCYHPPPSLSDQAKAAAVLLECQIWTMQFVLLRPFTSLARFILEEHIDSTTQTDSVVGTTTDVAYDDTSNNYLTYIQSPRFAIDMVTNISVFLAFHGLLKFYHAVHHDLKWCKPFSKFLTIKGIVFLTFWQGLAISILCNIDKNQPATTDNIQHRFLRYLNATTNSSGMEFDDTSIMNYTTDRLANTTSDGTYDILENTTTVTNGTYAPYLDTGGDDSTNTFSFASNDPNQESARIQNFLICLEMLFFSLAHWCVFSAEEWRPDYRPPEKPYAKPGIGLKDFASDIGYIVSSSTSARAYNKQQRQQRKKQNTNTIDSTQETSDDDPSIYGDDDTSIASTSTDIVIQTIENNDGSVSTMKSTPGSATPATTSRRRFLGGWGRSRSRYENIQHHGNQSMSANAGLQPVFEQDPSFVTDNDNDISNYDEDDNDTNDGVELSGYNNSHSTC